MAKRIKELRELNKLTQEELGNKVGVQKAAVQKWESGMTKNLKRSVIKKLSDIFGVDPSYLMGMSDIKNKVPLKNYTTIPMLGNIAAGEPILVIEESEKYIVTNNDIEVTFCLKVKGDSMINARINNGDIVFIREQCQVENGEIAAVLIDDEVVLKRFYKNDGLVMLKSENSKYEPLMYTAKDFKQIKILGKAVFFQSQIN